MNAARHWFFSGLPTQFPPVGGMAGWFILAVFLFLGGCASTTRLAPVVDVSHSIRPGSPAYGGDWRPRTYTVKKNDTLYSIALDFGFDYRELARWNGIDDPSHIKAGQVLRLMPPGAATARAANATAAAPRLAPVVTRPLTSGGAMVKTQPQAVKIPYSATAMRRLAQAQPPATLIVTPAPPASSPRPAAAGLHPATPGQPLTATTGGVGWTWPTRGQLIAHFNHGGNKGIDIAGKSGQPVLASASGKVVYAGSGLRGYGKLIIIKHNRTFLSAYAHNRRILVKEGQKVTKGEKVAEMGDTDAKQVELHFEIRRFGKPVDPLKYLPRLSS